MKFPCRKACLLSGLFAVFSCLNALGAAPSALEQVGPWNNVVDFSINRAENHLIMTLSGADGRTLLYEAFYANGKWGDAVPIDVLNRHAGNVATLGGASLADNERRLYFHANYPGGAGGFDIYYTDLTPAGWSEPQLLGGINTADDETFPALIPGEETVYFLKHQKSTDPKIEKKESTRLSIYCAERNPHGQYNEPEPVNNVLNVGYVQDVAMSADAHTMYYAMRSDRKEATRLMFTRLLWGTVWLQPAPLVLPDVDTDCYSPQCAGSKLYFVRANNKKQLREGSIMRTRLVDKATRPLDVVTEKGHIQTLGSHKPVAADLTVYNPTTLKVLGRFGSEPDAGAYELTQQAGAQYLVDVRSPGYSFASYLLDYRASSALAMPPVIELFDTVRLSVSVYDSEIFRPLDGAVKAVRTSDKTTFPATPQSDGKYLLVLPLGSDYDITAAAHGFFDNTFLFRIEGDIVFSYFERNLPLDPLKRDMTVTVVDAETKQPLAARVLFDNRNREEECTILPAQLVDGKATVKLRDSDAYDLTVDGADGYAFHSRMVDMKEQTGDDILVELIPLKLNASLLLNNINFATGSADIMPESYPELDRVAKLLRENVGLQVEIAAHTDNVGNATYNDLLSERRAKSAVNYLIESGISPDRLQYKGYGMSRPLVPNDSEANRARNRRVEFVITATKSAEQ